MFMKWYGARIYPIALQVNQHCLLLLARRVKLDTIELNESINLL